MGESPGLVSAWNEWDPLEEVVVGIADGAQYDPTEPGYRPKVRGTSEPLPRGPRSPEAIARAAAELDGLADLLMRRGITVRRPTAIAFDQPATTPAFSVASQLGATCPRDVMITIGTEIIEAPMSRRARFFEHLTYRPLVQQYFANDPGMTWIAAPRPTMGDDMYRDAFWETSPDERYAAMHDFEFCVTQDEMVFDAADITRCGKDVFVQESMTTNRAGIAWLRRHLGARGVRVRPLRFPLDCYPSHIDCTFVPLRPGLALTNPDRPGLIDDLLPFTANGWELVDAPAPVLSEPRMPRFCQSSPWLSMNVLSLSPTTVVCEEGEHALHELLEQLGFEVLTIPFAGVYEFGGSLHCATWDIRRRGTCQDHFPTTSG